MSSDYAMLLSLAWPMVVATLVVLLGRWPNVRDITMVVTSLVLLPINLIVYRDVMDGGRPSLDLVPFLPNFELGFQAEPLGVLFAMVASTLWPITAVYAIGYMRGHHEKNQTRFFFFFSAAIAAAMGVAWSRDLLTLFVFYEVLTVSTYPLVTHHQDEEALRGGRRYIGILMSTSVLFLLAAILWTWEATGNLVFTPGGFLAGTSAEAYLVPLLALFAFGIAKAALMPFHRWLPNAMVAPTPVSALLHAVAVVKAGVFSVLKVVVYVFGIDLLTATQASVWLVYMAVFTLLTASLIAMTKDNLKERLAYSTISQLAYIVLGAALANKYGILGGGMHIAMHAAGKITLFFCAGAIYVHTHKKNISQMRGLGREMPWTFGAFAIGALSIIGVPPTGGSWSKLYLVMGAADASLWLVVAALMISSLFNIGYLMTIPAAAFFREPLAEAHDDHGHGDHGHDDHHGGEAPILTVAPLVTTAALTVALFFFPEPIRNLLLELPLG